MIPPRPRAVVASTVPITLNSFHRELIRQVSLTHEVHVISSPGSDLDELRTDLGIDVHALPMTREISPRVDAVAMRQWVSLLRELKPEAVITATPKASLLGMLAARVTGVPKRLYYCGGLRLEGEQGKRRRLLAAVERVTGTTATAVVVNSPSLAARARELRLFPPRKLHATSPASSHGVDSTHFHPREPDEGLREKLGLKDGVPVIGFVGRLTHDKGIDTLIDGLKEIERRGLAAQLLVVGPHDEPDSQKYVERLSALGAHVVLAGGQRDVRPYFSLMDVHVLPSHREGFPNVVLEASSMAVPTVTTRATGCVDSVRDGETGRLHEVGDAVGFADGYEDVLEHRSQYGASAMGWARESFAPELVVKSLLRPLALGTGPSILHVINSVGTGGAEKLVVGLVRQMREEGRSADLACLAPSTGPVADAAARAGIEVTPLGRHRFDPLGWARLAWHTRRYDIVHAHLFPAFWAAALAPGAKVLTEHSPTNSRRSLPAWGGLEQIFYSRYDRLVAISEGVALALADYLSRPLESIDVIHNGIDLHQWQGDVSPRKTDELRVIAVGTLDKRKCVDDAIRIVAKLPCAHLTVVGDGPDRDALESLAKGIAPGRVTFIGHTADVAASLADADVFLSTSRYEGFGIAALEAMASGVPVVAPRVPGLAEVVHSGGRLFEPGKLDEAARILTDYAENDALRMSDGASAKSRAGDFSLQKTTEGLLALYEEVNRR